MSEEHKLNFMSGLARLHSIHGLSIDENDYLELAFSAWDKIGDKAMGIYQLKVEHFEGATIKLPCNYYSVEAIVSDRLPIVAREQNIFTLEQYNSLLYQYGRKPFSSDLYNIRGQFTNYSIIDSTVIFEQKDSEYLKDSTVTIYHKGVLSDSDGYPLITERQAEAIAFYVAYILEHRRLLRRIGDANLVTYLKQEWSKACARARVDEYISQNTMDLILDAQTSWNRKKWNLSLIV